MNPLLANYEEERQLYRDLLDARTEKRILLFHGESGSGKTALVDHCLHSIAVPSDVRQIIIDFKGGTVNLAKVFYEIGQDIQWQHLPQFKLQLATFDAATAVQIDRNVMAGIGNRINVILSPEDVTTRQYRLAALSEALLNDLESLPHLALLIVDTYEQSTTGVQEWIETYLLDWTARLDNLRVVVAGQSVPALRLKWRRYAATRRLTGVMEPHHWLPVVHSLHPHTPEEKALFLLEAVCRAYRGRPDAIMKVIQALP